VRLGGPLREQMHSAVHVGVVLQVVARDRVDHRARLLAGGGAVEIDERLSADLLVQGGKVLANRLHVQGLWRERMQRLGRHATSFSFSHSGSREVTSSRTRARSGASGMRFTISLAKA